MLRKIINLGLLFIVGSLFTGCVKWQNGIAEQDIEDVQKRSKVSIYIDNEATLKAEKDFLNLAKKEFKKGVDTSRIFTLKDKVGSNYKKIKDNKKHFIGFYPLHKNADRDFSIDIIIDNISYNDFNKFNHSTLMKKASKKISFDFDIVDRTLVSKKKYSNKKDVLIDFYDISSAINGKLGSILVNETGYQYFILDGNALERNKMVLKPLTKRFSYKDEAERVFKSFGYKIAKNKEQSDITIETEVISFGQIKYLKDTKRVANLFTIPRADGNVSQLAMDISSFNGGSSGASAALGLAVFALDFLSSSDKNDFLLFNTLSTMYYTGTSDPKKVSVLRPKPRKFYSPQNVYYEHNRHIIEKSFNGKMGDNVESLVKYVDYGFLANKYDKELKVGEGHKKGVLER